MKTIKNKWVFIVALIFAGSAVYADIEIGDPRDKVLSSLGEPQSSIKSGDYEMLRYPRGKVEMQQRKVTFVELMSEEVYEAGKARWREQRAAVQNAAQKVARELINTEPDPPPSGAEVKERVLNDTGYQSASASRQASIWRNFMKKYPEVDVSGEYQAVLARMQVDLNRDQQERTVKDLELQVEAAERRAAEAERELAKNSNQKYVAYDSTSPVIYYEKPIPQVYISTSPYQTYGTSSRGYSVPTYTTGSGYSCYTKPVYYSSRSSSSYHSSGSHRSSYRYGGSYHSHSRPSARVSSGSRCGLRGSVSFRY